MRQFFLYLIAILSATSLALAQSPVDNTARFPAASIKPAVEGQLSGCIGAMCGGRTTDDPSFRDLQTRLLEVLEWAYGKTSFQIFGPDWLTSDSPRFDVAATVPPGTSEEQFAVMLRNLMVDRMGLKVHHETRSLPANKLKVAEGGFKLNPAPNTNRGQGMRGSFSRHRFTLATEDVASAKTLSGALQNFLHESVIDETGLTGNYQFTLKWSDAGAMDGATPLPDLATALDRLGLQLEKGAQDFDVLVVDHVEKTPAGN